MLNLKASDVESKAQIIKVFAKHCAPKVERIFNLIDYQLPIFQAMDLSLTLHFLPEHCYTMRLI